MEYRTCLSNYFVFGTIFGIPLVLSFAILIRGAAPSWWLAFAVSSISLASSVLALSRYRLVITPDSVTYSSPLLPHRMVRRSDIVHADFADETGPFESPITFVIQGRAGENMRINAKVFSRDALGALVDLGQVALPARGPGPPLGHLKGKTHSV
jgi:hypothetical protein